MQRLKLFIPLVVFLILAVLLMGRLISGDMNQEVPSALINKPMPTFVLPALSENQNADSEEITTASLNGQPYLLNAWATWCQPCRYEHPVIVSLSEQGVNVVGLNYKDDAQAARKWLKELDNPYTHIIFDEQGRLGLDLGVTGIPETYFVDRQGVIRYKHVGIIDETLWRDRLEPIWQSIAAQEIN